MMFKKMFKIFIALFIIVILAVSTIVLYRYNFIPHIKYTNEDFDISPIISSVDKDGDGVDDQTDIIKSTKEYVATKPQYKSKYYNGGYPDDEYGVCTDVVAIALKNSGYDLMKLVDEDIRKNPSLYGINTPDSNIDFRRVRNLKIYFDRNSITLTTDITEIDKWHGGDIVIFPEHIGIVSDARNKDGIPFIIHHAWAGQPRYEEDVLKRYDIIGHYRISE